jgi:TolB protein
MDADGGNSKNLNGDHAYNVARAAWSPDSKQIAFSNTTEAGSAIWVIDIDGSHANALTPENGDDLDPIWSSDGQQIAFIRGSRGNQDIWLINADGSDAHQLTFSQKSIAQLAWSPDGKTLAFISSASDYNELYIMQPDGSDLHKAAPVKAADLNFVWSPDSAQILVRSNVTGGQMGVLMLVDLTAKKRTTIMDDSYSGGMPAWMPDVSISS